ncbi:hypothetical protein HC928_05400 [bacterium]|nr:hypothetical protein [bacterium]
MSVNKILSKIPAWQRILTMFFVVISPGFVVIFFDFIYPERNVVFWLAVLLACSQGLLKPNNSSFRYYTYGVIISSQFCLYYKEPVFILIGTYAGVKLVLSALANSQGKLIKANYKTWVSSLRNVYADFSILVLSGTFLGIYQIQIAPHVVSNYQAHVVESSFSTFLTYVSNDFLLASFLFDFYLKTTLSSFI